MIKKILIALIVLTIPLSFIFAQEDLGIREPDILPGNPFYFLKNIRRGIQSFFTFDQVGKLELKAKYASERLLEMRELVERKEEELYDKAIENYQKAIEEIAERTEKIKEKVRGNPKIDSFLNKFTKHQALHHGILEELTEKVPERVMERIREAREKHLEKFGEVMEKLEKKERIRERLEKNLKERDPIKGLKRMRFLKDIEEKISSGIRNEIRRIRNRFSQDIANEMDNMKPGIKEKIQNYTEKIKNGAERSIEMIEEVKNRVRNSEARKNLEEAENKIRENIKNSE